MAMYLNIIPQASNKPKALTLALRQSNPQLSRLVLYKGKPRGHSFTKKSIQIYQARMQIEESFRDMKSTKFGMGFEHNHTYKTKRMNLLVMMTTLAEMVLVLLGKVVEQAGLSYRFQTNTYQTL